MSIVVSVVMCRYCVCNVDCCWLLLLFSIVVLRLCAIVFGTLQSVARCTRHTHTHTQSNAGFILVSLCTSTASISFPHEQLFSIVCIFPLQYTHTHHNSQYIYSLINADRTYRSMHTTKCRYLDIIIPSIRFLIQIDFPLRSEYIDINRPPVASLGKAQEHTFATEPNPFVATMICVHCIWLFGRILLVFRTHKNHHTAIRRLTGVLLPTKWKTI